MKKIFFVMLALLAQQMSLHATTYLRVHTIAGKIEKYDTETIKEVAYDGEFPQIDTAGMGNLSATGLLGDYSYVDLGLSVRWATCNVGASKPAEYGDYFAWGETEPKTSYNWNTYKYCVVAANNSGYEKLTKYSQADGKTTLDPEDDAATVNWGVDWRMPTHSEQLELVKGCDWKWIANFNGSGIGGYMGTSKKNGRTIFLPSGGTKQGGTLNHVGRYGDYYSSSLLGATDDFDWQPHCLKTDNSTYQNAVPVNAGQYGQCTGSRELGLTVRACTDAKVPAAYMRIKDNNGREYAYELADIVKVDIESTNEWGVTISGKVDGFMYVDLGLPSGTKWAACNVGSSVPAMYGGFFSWGETNSKYRFDSNGYELSDKSGMLSKYCFDSEKGEVDNISVLLPADDAASVLMGESWRMPTKEDFLELIEGCTWTREKGFAGTRFNGLLGKSKTNGATIFFPTNGLGNGGNIVGGTDTFGYYWSSTLSETNSSAAYFFYFRYQDEMEIKTQARFYGSAVRGVLK